MGPADDICPWHAGMSKVERIDGKRCYCPMGVCPAGAVCYEQTKASSRARTPCSPGYYCPEGTGGRQMLLTPCPNGTTSDAGAQSVSGCHCSQGYEVLCRWGWGWFQVLTQESTEAVVLTITASGSVSDYAETETVNHYHLPNARNCFRSCPA